MPVGEGKISDVAPHGECLGNLLVHHLPGQLSLVGVFWDTVGEVQGPPSVRKMILKHYHVSQNGITFIFLIGECKSTLCYEMNYFLARIFTCWAWGGGPDHRLQIQKTYPLCRGGRNCQTQRIFLLSSSAADDWPSVNQTSDQSENQKLNFSRVSHYYFFHPIHSISYLNRFLIFYINVSDLVFHSAPF